MANKETRIYKTDTLESLRQKSNEISLHLGDNEQLNALLADKTYNYSAALGDTLFAGPDTSSPAKTARFEVSPAHTVDNTGGYIILEGVSSLHSSYIAGAVIYQGNSSSPSYSATIVSATVDRILVRDSSGTFSTSTNLNVSSNSIAHAKIKRIVIEAYPIGIVRVYKNGTELSQTMTTNGFHVANIRGTITHTGSPTLTNYTEGVTVYQGSSQTTQADVEANATWYGTLHSVSGGVIRVKTYYGSFTQSGSGSSIRALGSSDTIASHGALVAVDSTYGSYIELSTPAAGSDAIKVYSLDVVAAINELQHDIGTVESLTTAANDLVTAINEHDAELGTITAGALGTSASTVSTAIREHEDQIGNVSITDIASGNNTITGALDQLHDEVGDVTASNLGTAASDLTAAIREHEDQIGNDNINTISSTNNTIKTALNQLHTEVGSLSLNTSANDLTAAINEHEADIGNMTLTGLSASDLSAAVRELRSELGNHLEIDDATGYSATTAVGGIKEIQGDIGNVDSLDTNTTADLVAAINELENVLRDDTTQRTGYVMGTNANNVITAINEIETVLRGSNSNYTINTAAQNVRDAINEHETQIGNLVFGAGGPVDAANSTVLTGAINVLDAEIGDTSYTGADLTTAIKNTQDDILVAGSLTSLNTTNKFIVGAINETDASIFNSVGINRRTLNSLSTADKTSIVDSINEIYADIHTAGSVTLDTEANFLVGAINEIEGVFDASAYEISAGSNAFNIISGELVLNSSTNIILDADGGDIRLKDDGTAFAKISKLGNNLRIYSEISDGDLLLQGNDGGSVVTALTLDMSDAGAATFNNHVTAVGTSSFVNLDISGNVDVDGSLETDGLSINGTTVTATATELNVMDGNTSATSTTLVDADRLVVNDDGTMKQVAVTDLTAYFDHEITNMPNLVQSGALNSGSITSGFGSINIGSSTITTSGSISGGAITGTSFTIGSASINEAELERIDGLTIGTVTASKVVTVNASKDVSGFRNITLTGELDAGSLDISGNADIDGTLNVQLGTTLQSTLSVQGNTTLGNQSTDTVNTPGVVTISNATESSVSSATDGALIVTGGASIGKNLYVGGNLQVEGTQTILNTETLTVEDTLVLAGNNLSSEPSTGGFGLEVGPITSPSGVAAGVTGAHSIVYNYGHDNGDGTYGRWEADGSLILSTATLSTPQVEGVDFGPNDNLTFNAGTGLSETVTKTGATIVTEYVNTDRGSVAATALKIFSSAVPSSGTTATADNNNDALNLTQGTGISTVGSGDNVITITNTDRGSVAATALRMFKTITLADTPDSTNANVVADNNADILNLRGLDAITLTSVPGTDTISIDHDNFGTAGTYGQTSTQDGAYIKSIITNDQGHVTAVTTGDFDTRYQPADPTWDLKVSNTLLDSVANGESVDFRLAQVDTTNGLTISTAGSTSTASIITLGHANTSSITGLTSNNSDGTVIQDLTLTYDTYGHALTSSVATTNLDNRYMQHFTLHDGDGSQRTIERQKEVKFIEGTGDGATIDINWTDVSTGSDADPYDLTFNVTNTDKGSVAATALRMFKNVVSDSGTAVADDNADTLSILGGTNISTAVVGDVLTITNDYVHPAYAGDDIDIDTTALVGATVISDLDFNITTDTLGHVVDANGTVSTRNLGPGDLGIYGWDVLGNGTQVVADILNDDVDFRNGNHTTAAVTANGNNAIVKFNHNAFTSGGTFVGGADNGIVIEDFYIDSYGHVRSVGTRDLDGRYDKYTSWTFMEGNGVETGVITSGDTLHFEQGNYMQVEKTLDDQLTFSVVDPGWLLSDDEKTATLTVDQNSGSNNNPKLLLSDGSTDTAVTIVGGTNITVTRNSNSQLEIDSTASDVDVSVSNLETRLGQIDSNVTIGNASTVHTTTSGNLTVTGDLTVSGATTTVNTETVTIQDNIIVLNSNAANTPTEDGGIEVERGSSVNSKLLWDESETRWYHTYNNAGSISKIPHSVEDFADVTSWNLTADAGGTATITKGDLVDIGGTAPISTTRSGDGVVITHDNQSQSNTTSSTSLAHSGSFAVVSGVAVNTKGHVTGTVTTTYTLPAGAVPNDGLLDINAGSLIDLTITGGDFSADKSDETDITIDVDLSELNDMTETVLPGDKVVFLDVSETEKAQQKKIAISGVALSLFDNDEGFTDNIGDITRVNITAGKGLVGSVDTTSGDHTQTLKVNLISDTAQTVAANGASTTASRTYPIQFDSDSDLVVNVPWTDTQPSPQTTFQVEDGDGTEVTISNGKEWKFVEGSENVTAITDNYININWTDVSTGSDADPYDLTFSHKRTTRSNSSDTETLTFGGTFDAVQEVTSNATGHLTARDIRTFTLPANPNTDSFLNSVSTVDNGSDMILRHSMNDGTTTHDIGITAGTGITLTPGTETFEIKSTTNLSYSRTSSIFTLTSSNGNNTTLPAADDNGPGLLTAGGHMLLSTVDANANQNIAGDGISLTNSDKTISLDYDQRLPYSGGTHVKIGHSGTNGKSYLDFNVAQASGDSGYIDVYTSSTTTGGSEALNARFASGGDFHAEGDIIAYSSTIASDAKLKENIEKVEGALDKVSQLDGVTFTWKKNGKESAGVIAQNVEEVLPRAVNEVEELNSDDTHKVVDYNQLSALFIEAIKELKEENKLLKAEIESLKDINS